MLKKIVEVTQHIEVTVDETKFTPEFMREFRESFYPFTSLEDHLCHLGQLFARGLCGSYIDPKFAPFIEGYGPAHEMGINFRLEDQEQRIA